ncbi:PREDICTED: uncharacterized protein LOC104806260 [Tarenaya hassleriana]|uniref:uncharacterized protein LOC104806260 n=1 Tax=Tarenaya hassleriana TaxID=28532 RepID=UPI00053CA9B2|nr:PREDICTED: uncharacterized protein LOC104806260 [Tarenaya hassleriana]
METNGGRSPNPDRENGFGYKKSEKPEEFVMIDVESFASVLHKDISSSPRFSMQRNVSRKFSGRSSSNDRKLHYDANGNGKDSSTPQSPLRGSGTPEKSTAAVGAPVDPTDLSVAATAESVAGSPLHQITITAGNLSDQTERRFGYSKKTSFKRSWILDPKKVVLFFATLSSMGSILLIIFTLSMRKSSPEDILP